MNSLEAVRSLVLEVLEHPLHEAGSFEHATLDMSKVHPAFDREGGDQNKIRSYHYALYKGESIKPIYVVRLEKSGQHDAVDGQHRYWAHEDAGI